MRLADRTHAGRAGRQALNARAFSPLTHRWCEAPVSHLAARDSQLAGPRHRRPTLNGWSSWLGRAAARLRLAASPTSWESRAPAGLGRAGLCPHQSPGVGALKNVGVFLTGGSPGHRLNRLGPVWPMVLRPEWPCIAPDALRAFGGRDQSCSWLRHCFELL